MEVDEVKGCLRACVALKRQNKDLKVLLSVGGGGKGSNNFDQIAADPGKRDKFARSAKALCETYNLDGIDGRSNLMLRCHSTKILTIKTVDWEHPRQYKEGKDYVMLLSVLREYLPKQNYELSSALPADSWALQFVNLSQVLTYINRINLMTYDFSGMASIFSASQSRFP